MEYIKYSAKAIWAFVVPLLIVFVQSNSEAVTDAVAGIVGAALTAIVVWLQKNGPKPV